MNGFAGASVDGRRIPTLTGLNVPERLLPHGSGYYAAARWETIVCRIGRTSGMEALLKYLDEVDDLILTTLKRLGLMLGSSLASAAGDRARPSRS